MWLWAKSGGWLKQWNWRLWHSAGCQCFFTVTESVSAASLAYVGLASCIVMGLQNIEPTTSMLHSGCLVKHRAPTLQASATLVLACLDWKAAMDPYVGRLRSETITPCCSGEMSHCPLF